MKALQPKNGTSTALMVVLVILVRATLGAQSTAIDSATPTIACLRDWLSQHGVFEGTDAIENEHLTSISVPDDRIRWLTFYQIYTDDVLSRYAPGGASGARFDLFQFAGFSGAQPSGYPIHILVHDGYTTLVGIVANIDDRQIAEVRARTVPGVIGVENALVVDRGPQ
jgi:hypothetical protein